ncbi:poly-gamma-glutamate hydrolase family protein [Natronolimnohabitans sp. A-GB9]|uniref:poly-gamma-glutamate hydrolase family protein n=1 Tax=Natronolimnohabitans sp. A-GB9 TaxID=3069757 RepID=UPI0027B47A51|nr:poly-gamma-glutamate hydrolase family protein [Natronolimnohabitans sp. A-GB9]MDQ2052940.1 poly-gamma-glutamate hydrolase family protein [Natronolimnohabitans sp. A-GB9]
MGGPARDRLYPDEEDGAPDDFSCEVMRHEDQHVIDMATVDQAYADWDDLISHSGRQVADERISVWDGLLDNLDLEIGDNIMLRNPDIPNQSAPYTILQTHEDEDAHSIRMGWGGRNRLHKDKSDEEVNTPDRFAVEITQFAPNHRIADSESGNELDTSFTEVEHHSENDIIVTAPHGGWIEPGTSEQTRILYNLLDDCSLWNFEGNNDGGGSFDRWHITSVDVQGECFPGFGMVEDHDWDWAISIHGFSYDTFLVGGLAPMGLREEIVSEVEDVIDAQGDDIEVTAPSEDEWELFNAHSEDNYINRMTENGQSGIQIEQPWETRQDEYVEEIPKAIARGLTSYLDSE